MKNNRIWKFIEFLSRTINSGIKRVRFPIIGCTYSSSSASSSQFTKDSKAFTKVCLVNFPTHNYRLKKQWNRMDLKLKWYHMMSAQGASIYTSQIPICDVIRALPTKLHGIPNYPFEFLSPANLHDICNNPFEFSNTKPSHATGDKLNQLMTKEWLLYRVKETIAGRRNLKETK